MGKALMIALAFLLALSLTAAASRQIAPNERPDCTLLFVEVELSNPALDGYTIYAPLYACRSKMAAQ